MTCLSVGGSTSTVGRRCDSLPLQRCRQHLRVIAASKSVLPRSSSQQRAQQAQAALGGWPLSFPLPSLPPLPSQLPKLLAPVVKQPEDDPEDLLVEPILSFGGGGLFFWWELGCLLYLRRNFDLSRVQLLGASAGGLIATIAACDVDEDKAIRVANRLAEEYGVFTRPTGLAGVWGTLIRHWLDELLPGDAAELCAGRVRLVATEVPSMQLRYLEEFDTREDLIDANMASTHIPFFLDGSPTTTYCGKTFMDGSLYDFFTGSNSNLLRCDDKSCVIDYFDDDQLTWGRLDFLRLADVEGVRELMAAGYAYAQRRDADSDFFESKLGNVRKGSVRKVLEAPLWRVRHALAAIDG